MTRIFYMFLKDVLHYRDIRIIPIHYTNSSDPHNPWYTLDYVRTYNGFHNISMINLEVWMPYSVYREPPANILNAGASITPGRFSWFVPKAQISTDASNCSLHYDVFKDIHNIHYDLYVLEDNLMDVLRNRSVEEYINPNCVNVKCATLIAEFRNDSHFVVNQLKESFVNVIWLGTEFRSTIQEFVAFYQTSYARGQKRFIVLHWLPSEIIDGDIKFTQITLPRCEDYQYLQNTNCRYELTPILKYYTISLANDKRLIYALRKFFITDEDIEYIQRELSIQRKHSSDPYDKVACNWLLNNRRTYSKWILPNTVQTLSIGGIFPINITDRGHLNIIGAAQKAVVAINKDPTILPDYNLEIMLNDGQCKSDLVMKAFIHYFNVPNMLGVLGPGCSETVEPIAGISKHLNMMAISYSAEGSSFVDRKAYPYFFRTIGSNSVYVDVYMRIMQQLGWSRVSTLTEDSQQYTEYMSRMETKLRSHNFTLAFSRKFPSDVTAEDMREHLGQLKAAHSKIIIAELHSDNAAVAICEAINLGAIEGHFSIRHTPFGQPNAKMQEGKSINSWLTTYGQEYETFSNYVGFVYDAVWTYAIAAHKLLQNNTYAVHNLRSKEVVNQFAQFIWATDFDGLSGKVRFGHGEFGGSRIIDLDILQWTNGSYAKVGTFQPHVRANGSDVHICGGNLSFSARDVFHGRIPEDGRYDCRFSGLARLLCVDCDIASMIFSVLMCLLAIMAMSLISFYFWKQRYDRKVRQSVQIMKMFGIDLISPSRNKINTLDKWEVPRENVVVNRRLGEGAFGTVYGGEAKFNSDDWTAVAVKTLKSGGSTEDRLDFLAEAEAMKKFNHKNIIKLLGVCLQKEPIYTIMQFMLYGDLKTYLLARRNMVNEKITDESDISSKRLTMYAMDVARGLAYLAEQKYVHRDIACRNCLVDSQRMVKIADFGMARPTFESDYYCFNRKGVRKLFPVRWMPPETLSLGLFTSASDIWSFGVVLFEVITFGSYPYQGMTNNQVLDFVKNGNTLQIPNGVKPQLEGLLKACWSQDASKRPTALEVIDYISNYPRLLTPCLDLPGTAVQLPESDDEMELLPNARLSSPRLHDSNLDILAKTNSAGNMQKFDIIGDGNLSELLATDDSGTVSMPHDSFSSTTPDGYSIMAPLLSYSKKDVNSNPEN
ncbi:GH13351 [Drosophila grimshawi]|uniref:receptor protein-tyrosine kinase n=1 Tax=Drosophila grimshawi TaxID=7222 RepID=B4JPQ9_DROGR|nr:GH13351 [Drosophila grimshawi]